VQFKLSQDTEDNYSIFIFTETVQNSDIKKSCFYKKLKIILT